MKRHLPLRLCVAALCATTACFNTEPPAARCTSDASCPAPQHCDLASSSCLSGSGGGSAGGSGGGSAGGSGGGSAGGSGGGSAGGSGGGSSGAACAGVADGGAGYTVGGSVTGLSGTALTLSTPGEPNLAVARGSNTGGAPICFAFSKGLPDQTTYQVAVATQPSHAQSCIVSNGNGVIDGGNIVDVQVACGPGHWSDVAAGPVHSLGLRTDGTLWAWGSNASGQLGTGTNIDSNVPLPVGSGYAAIAVGDAHSVAIKTDGTLWAWGSNSDGQLGSTAVSLVQGSKVPLQIGTGTNWKTVAAGAAHTLATTTTQAAYAWGRNTSGEVGNGGEAAVTVPTLISSSMLAVAGGIAHSAALAANGTVSTWGSGNAGALGNGSDAGAVTPTAVDGVPHSPLDGGAIGAVAAGACHTLVVEGDGTLWSWGCNASGQLGNATTTDALHAVHITGSNYAFVAPGEAASHSVAVTASGDLYAWGANASGQVGAADAGSAALAPLLVGSGYSAAAVGARHTLAIKSDGTLWVWGSNSSGQLGTAASLDAGSPVPIQLQ